MKVVRIAVLSALCAAPALAGPLMRRENPPNDDWLDGPEYEYSDYWNEMEDAIAGRRACGATGIMFAKGTFDTRNVGIKLGAYLAHDVKEDETDDFVDFQGVDEKKYLGTLEEYLKGGSPTGADALADTVSRYAKGCPGVPIIVAAWSQGALVAHRGLEKLSPEAEKATIGFVTFGDPNRLWDNKPNPAFIPEANVKPYCIKRETAPGEPLPDLLCAKIPDDLSRVALVEGLREVVRILANIDTTLLWQLFTQLIFRLGNVLKVGRDVITLNMQRELLLPPHFRYQQVGMVKDAAEVIKRMPEVVRAKAAHGKRKGQGKSVAGTPKAEESGEGLGDKSGSGASSGKSAAGEEPGSTGHVGDIGQTDRSGISRKSSTSSKSGAADKEDKADKTKPPTGNAKTLNSPTSSDTTSGPNEESGGKGKL